MRHDYYSVIILLLSCITCVFMPQRHQLNLRKLGRWSGIFNTLNDHSLHHTHNGETGIAEPAQALTQN